MGCYWHGHDRCQPDPVTRAFKKDANSRSLDERFAETQRISQYHRDQGYTLRVMWECDFKALKIDPPRTYYTPTEHMYRMNEKALLEVIEDGRMFGLAEVDIYVPEHLKPYFEDMSPIFKNIEVALKDIGPTMQEFCRDNNCSFTGMVKHFN